VGLLSDLRITIRDIAPPGMASSYQPRFQDSELEVFARNALMELNVWAATAYTIAQLDSALSGSNPSTIESAIYQLTLLLAQIHVIEADASSPDDYVKYMTQDTTVDPGDASLRVSRLLKSLQERFEKLLNHWIGVEHGRWLWTEAGESEF
jgi:hypothetical protein